MRSLLVALVALALVPFNASGQEGSQLSREAAARIVHALDGTGFRYSKVAPAAWTVSFEGTQSRTVVVLVLGSEALVMVEGIVAEHDSIADDTAAMRALMKLNCVVEGATYVIDEDDDFMARAVLALKALDGSKLKTCLQAVALATDAGYGAIASSLAGGRTEGVVGGTWPFNAPPEATTRVDLLGGRASLAYDPAKWKETLSEEPGRRTFRHVNGDGYAMVITERLQIPIDQLRAIAVKNARLVAPDVRIVEEGRRQVNGTEVIMLRMDGTSSGVQFTYFGYYYGGVPGTVQVVAYTGQNLFDEYRKDFEDFCDGLSIHE
jgi:hypothetical protein